MEILLKPERRPCYVKGRKGIFHQWFEKTDVIIVPERSTLVNYGKAEEAKRHYKNTGVIPNGFTSEQVTNTYALIEFEDGHIEEIPPVTITFLNTGEFKDYDWTRE